MTGLRRRGVRRVVGFVQLSVFLSACTSWRIQPTSPATLIATQRPSAVRVTQADSSRLTLHQPVVEGDTLYGFRQPTIDDSLQRRTGVPLTDVREIAIQRSDPTKTTLLVAGMVAWTFSVLCFGADALGCNPQEVF